MKFGRPDPPAVGGRTGHGAASHILEGKAVNTPGSSPVFRGQVFDLQRGTSLRAKRSARHGKRPGVRALHGMDLGPIDCPPPAVGAPEPAFGHPQVERSCSGSVVGWFARLLARFERGRVEHVHRGHLGLQGLRRGTQQVPPVDHRTQFSCLEALESIVPAGHPEKLCLENTVFPCHALQIYVCAKSVGQCSGQLALDPVVGDVLTHQKGRAGGDQERRDDCGRDLPTFHCFNRACGWATGQRSRRLLRGMAGGKVARSGPGPPAPACERGL